MCGLVAYRGDGAALPTLATAAEQAAKRGPHSHGWAWWDEQHGWQRTVGVGPLGAPPRPAAGAPIVVGHSRLATCGAHPGDTPPASESQPFVYDGLLLAHNGTVVDPDRFGRPTTVDSEAILTLAATGRDLRDILDVLGDAPQAIILADRAGRLVCARQRSRERPGHPLWCVDTAEGRYVASRPFSASCRALPEGVTVL